MSKPEQDKPEKSMGVFISMEQARESIPEGIKQMAANIVRARRESEVPAKPVSEK